MNLHRRTLIGRAAGLGLAASLPRAFAAPAASSPRFAPQAGDWRTFDLVTRVTLPATTSATRAWCRCPRCRQLADSAGRQPCSSNGQARIAADGAQGVRLAAQFDAGVEQPFLEVTCRVRTQSRVAGTRRVPEDTSTLRAALQATR
jgi:hypothetical protein